MREIYRDRKRERISAASLIMKRGREMLTYLSPPHTKYKHREIERKREKEREKVLHLL